MYVKVVFSSSANYLFFPADKYEKEKTGCLQHRSTSSIHTDTCARGYVSHTTAKTSKMHCFPVNDLGCRIMIKFN